MSRDIKDIIKITEAARNYLHKKNKLNICIEYPEYRTGNDCAFVQVPEIFAKKPKSEEGYSLISLEGINIFLSKLINLPDNDIIIDVSSFLGMKILTISGFNSRD
ncbi:CC/Se motif family (seleno)protein [Sedimentibacter sp.]|uniref:CC/Se motif family (seleno)protein n=1 Tax=Sedimentibacter sp. TaxID=1960295 RepID=UPI0028A0A514|nr:CC/Se motif family (seleno)protein [Sedimentibacter sp.]